MPRQVEPAHPARHDDVGEQEIDVLALEQFEPLGGPVGLDDAITQFGELPADDAAHCVVVFDDENALIAAGDGGCRLWSRFREQILGTPARQVKTEGRTVAHLAVHIDVAARLLHEAKHHAKPEPGAFAWLLGGEERFEDLAYHVGRDAGSGIAYFDHGILARVQLGMHGDIISIEGSIGGRDHQPPPFGHRIAGIGRQIDEARLELGRIDHHRPDIRGKIERDVDVFAQRSSQQADNSSDEIVDIDGLGLERLATCEGKQPARQIGAPHRSVDRLPDQFVGCGGEGRAAQYVKITNNDAEQVVEIMRHAAGEVADRLHLLRLEKLRLRLLGPTLRFDYCRLVGCCPSVT